MSDDCESCDGSGIEPCDAPWCADPTHGGSCRDCAGTGDLHVRCPYCRSLRRVNKDTAKCSSCKISARRIGGRWRVSLPAGAVPFAWVSPDGEIRWGPMLRTEEGIKRVFVNAAKSMAAIVEQGRDAFAAASVLVPTEKDDK